MLVPRRQRLAPPRRRWRNNHSCSVESGTVFFTLGMEFDHATELRLQAGIMLRLVQPLVPDALERSTNSTHLALALPRRGIVVRRKFDPDSRLFSRRLLDRRIPSRTSHLGRTNPQEFLLKHRCSFNPHSAHQTTNKSLY